MSAVVDAESAFYLKQFSHKVKQDVVKVDQDNVFIRLLISLVDRVVDSTTHAQIFQ